MILRFTVTVKVNDCEAKNMVRYDLRDAIRGWFLSGRLISVSPAVELHTKKRREKR